MVKHTDRAVLSEPMRMAVLQVVESTLKWKSKALSSQALILKVAELDAFMTGIIEESVRVVPSESATETQDEVPPLEAELSTEAQRAAEAGIGAEASYSSSTLEAFILPTTILAPRFALGNSSSDQSSSWWPFSSVW